MLIPFLLAMLVATIVLFFMSRSAVERIEHNHYEQRADLYRFTPIKKAILSSWATASPTAAAGRNSSPGLPVKNRGINGDDYVGVLNRLEPSCITALQPYFFSSAPMI